MKISLDECVDQRFRKELIGHEVITVQKAGWAGKKNGELLSLAAKDYQAFITVDRNLYFQQNLPKLQIAVLIMAARTNRLADLTSLAVQVLQDLPKLNPGDIRVISQMSYYLFARAIVSKTGLVAPWAFSNALRSSVKSKVTSFSFTRRTISA